jgi:hypothetical protein
MVLDVKRHALQQFVDEGRHFGQHSIDLLVEVFALAGMHGASLRGED